MCLGRVSSALHPACRLMLRSPIKRLPTPTDRRFTLIFLHSFLHASVLWADWAYIEALVFVKDSRMHERYS